MRHLISASILALSLALSTSVHAEEWFRLNLDAPIFFGAGVPDIGENNPITFVVNGDAAGSSVDGRDLGTINIPITVNGIDASHTVDVDGLPDGASWNGSAIIWSPASEGSYDLTIEVRDENDILVASQGVELVIHQPLTASVPETEYEVEIGEDLTITPTAANAIGALQWGSTPSELPEWLDFDAATGVIDVDTAEANELGEIVLTAVDQADLMSASTLPFSISVNGADTDYWLATLGGASSDIGQSIRAGSDGSLYVTGYTNSTGAGGYDLLIAKYGANGSLSWKKTLGGASTDYGYGIAAGSDGSLYVTGSISSGAGGYDLLIARYGSDGSLNWQKTLGGATHDNGRSIAAGPDGSLYVTGSTASSGAGGHDLLIAKYGANGSLSWKKTLGGASTDYGYGIAAGSDGSLYVAGYTNSAGAGSNDILITKYGSDGNLSWKKTLGGESTDIGYDIAAGSDGSLYVTGYTQSAGSGGIDVLIARLPADGGDDMVAGSLTWQDAELTVGPNPSLTVSSPSWTSPDANLTPNDASALVPGNAAALTSTTTDFEQQAQP
ncbi:MAG: SBBP repeat-containing protein [Devosia sp.]|uniref:SBBP repeat-containing protein n=1 Tax=Devosia sp. TaxID=1871048 RepID=UPI001ACA7676|nr:SBBP repeat-containing protein [Devosia sp.]MBN9317091.1 SBBP repeat-containing protein [Devosia sp.]